MTIRPRSRRVHITATAVVAAAALALSGCSAGTSSGDSTSLTLATSYDFQSFDPGELTTGGEGPQYWMPVYDTLLTSEPDGSLSPGLATSWEYNEDNTVLTLQLRDDVTFTDGEKFDGDAVKAAIEHTAEGSGADKWRSASVDEVTVLSPTEVQFTLEQPDPFLLTNLAFSAGAIGAPDALENPDIKTTPVGSGPYMLDVNATTIGSQFVYTRNPDYWNADAWPYDKINLKVIADLTARVNAVKSGQADGALIDQATSTGFDEAKFSVYSAPVDWVGINIADRDGVTQPALSDVRVRQAIAMAFDREKILKNVDSGAGVVTEQMWSEGTAAYDPSIEGTYPYDPDRAKELLAEAGYPDGFDVEMMDLSIRAKYQPIVQQYLAAIGIRVTYVPINPANIFEEFTNPKYTLHIASIGGGADPWDNLTTVLPDGFFNPFHSQTPELDAIVQKIRVTSGDEQSSAYQEANRYVTDNAWVAPWYKLDSFYVTTSDTTTERLFGAVVPLIRSFAPAS
jgi:peptide/nickel transport system substrate-binding protein